MVLSVERDFDRGHASVTAAAKHNGRDDRGRNAVPLCTPNLAADLACWIRVRPDVDVRRLPKESGNLPWR
jgi:hypothetical protein